MKRVIIESPYAGKTEEEIMINEIYGEFCMRDCLTRHDETPYASHLLYTRKHVLRDHIKEERKLGIQAGFFWRDVAEQTNFYIDLGMTPGMNQGIDDCEAKGKPYKVRHLPADLWEEFQEACESVGIITLAKMVDVDSPKRIDLEKRMEEMMKEDLQRKELRKWN